jgi:flavin reductase (DIM6/NTAB) family NADH-FMN oxidoreductase RutF
VNINPRDFRSALGRFASGVTVITVHHEDHTHGMTANAFVSVSLDPPLVLVSLDNRSNMHRLLPGTGRYGVSVLAENQEALSNHFAGQTVPELRVPVLQAGFTMRNGIPLLDGAVAHFIVKVTEVHPAGDHTLYLGQVEYLAWRDARPLLFYAGRYQQLRAATPHPVDEHEFSLFSIGGFDPKSIK